MTTAIQLPEGAPEEVVTNALVRDVDLAPFGFKGTLALITLDNGFDHTRPNTFGPLESHLSLQLALIYQHWHFSISVSKQLQSESWGTMYSAVSTKSEFLPLHLSMDSR
jgi:hypothetical protein